MKKAMRFTVGEKESVNGKIALYALCNRMELVACESADSFNLSSERLVSEGFAWALIKMCLDITHHPATGEKVILCTWPVGISGIQVRRDYQMTDTEGHTLMRGTSEWVVLNLAKRRVTRVPDFIVNANFSLPEFSMEEPDYKLPSAEDFPVLRITHANNDDIDINDHVNNVRYIKWIERAMPEEISLKSFEIIYKKEALLGDQIFAKGGSCDGSYLVSLYRKDGEIVQSRINGLM